MSPERAQAYGRLMQTVKDDGPQALKPDTFQAMMDTLVKVAEATGRKA